MRQTGWSDMLTEREADFTCSYTVVPLPLVTADLKQTNKQTKKRIVLWCRGMSELNMASVLVFL